MSRIFLVFTMCLCFFQIQAQKIIPFYITESNNIHIKTLVNAKDSLELMFQIAMEDAAISPDRIRSVNHIEFDKNDFSHGNTIQIGALSFNDINFYNNELSGRGSDGKLGRNIFKGKSFKIDYDQARFEIYDELPDINGFEAIPIEFKDDVFFITVQSFVNSEVLSHQFYLQTGYAGGLLYDNEFSERHELETKLNILKSTTLKNSAGKEVITNDAIIPYLKIGNIVLKNMSVSFFAGELKTQHLSLLGAGLMKRFNWIFDIERKFVYIKSNKYFGRV